LCACPERYTQHTPRLANNDIAERRYALRSKYRALAADFSDRLKLFVSVTGHRPLPSFAGHEFSSVRQWE
jgi:hypothetical protein